MTLTSVDDARLRKHLIDSEGRERSVYLDSLGKKTGGIGHLLEGTTWRVGDPISDEQIDAWFEADLVKAVAAAKTVVGAAAWDAMSRPRREAVVDAVFQLGPAGFAGYKRCVAAIQRGDWGVGAYELLDSRGAQQTRRRFLRRARCFVYGEWGA